MSLQHPARTSVPTGPLPAAPAAAPGYVPTGSPSPSIGLPAAGDRLPRPPRRRSAGLAALAVLLVAGGAAVAGLLALRLDQRVDVLVARQSIGAGEQITADMLAVAPVAADGPALIPVTRRGEVVGRYAAVPIPAGRLLDTGMVTDRSTLRAGTVAIGVVVAPGAAPARGLEAGDRVTVYGTDGEGEVITSEALVSSFVRPEQGSFGATSSDTVATLIVPESAAARVAAAAAAGKVSLGLTERGAPLPGDDG